MGREGDVRRVIEVREDDEKQAPADREARGSRAARPDDKEDAGAGPKSQAKSADARLKPPPAKGTMSTPKLTKGLGEDVLTQVAQAKFEAQEEKLRDVARHSMSLLRDYGKINAGECAKRVTDIRRCLAKYDMQYIRVWDLQERVRVAEVAELASTTASCVREAAAEAQEIVELRATLSREEQRRKRYEGYEETAAEINCKKSRKGSQASIDVVTADIAKIKQQQADLEAMAELRTQRAQLLVQAVADLKADLDQDRPLAEPTAGKAAAPAPLPGPVEVIS